jgi:hypothetical protein
MPNLHHHDESKGSAKVRVNIKLERDLGSEILASFIAPEIIEIMLNSDGKFWRERLPRCFTG